MRGAERCEIVLADQVAGGRFHGSQVQRPKDPAGAPGFQTGSHGRFQQHVCVSTARRAGTRMERFGHLVCPLHRHIARQVAVCSANPRAHGTLHIGVKVNHLAQTVHARIGATRAQSVNVRNCCELRQGTFKMILHRLPARLALPALVGAAQVTDAERDPQSHPVRRRPTRSRELSQESPGAVLQSPAGFGFHFFSQ